MEVGVLRGVFVDFFGALFDEERLFQEFLRRLGGREALINIRALMWQYVVRMEYVLVLLQIRIGAGLAADHCVRRASW